MISRLFSSLLLGLISTSSIAQPAAPTGLGLKDGDRIIWIGDSITHQCQYTQYVEDFFYTRYPKMRLHFRNAGVSGDVAADALNRFDDDIASFKPTVATVLLGMNDGRYQDFTPEIFQTYARDMTTLLDKLDALKMSLALNCVRGACFNCSTFAFTASSSYIRLK